MASWGGCDFNYRNHPRGSVLAPLRSRTNFLRALTEWHSRRFGRGVVCLPPPPPNNTTPRPIPPRPIEARSFIGARSGSARAGETSPLTPTHRPHKGACAHQTQQPPCPRPGPNKSPSGSEGTVKQRPSPEPTHPHEAACALIAQPPPQRRRCTPLARSSS